MHVIWYPRSTADLDGIRSFIAQDDPSAATRLVERIFAATRLLSNHPKMGRPGRVAATRELVVSGTPYIVIYEARPDHVAILRVYHAARRWPRDLGA